MAVTVGGWVKLGRTGGLREFDIQGSRIVRLSGLQKKACSNTLTSLLGGPQFCGY